ncbi:MAG: PrsW family glutamic-type intramembrane protease [Candidatus Hadarchaeales archaeon]
MAYLICLLGGLTAIIMAVMIELPLLLAFRERAIQALITGFVEEPVKQIGVAFVAFKSSIISSPRMGAIGGAFAGLGFGGIEAILFISFLSYAIPSHEAVTLRIPLVLFHIFLSAIAGAGVYFGASGGAVGKIKMVVLIALASTIHSLWNYVAFTAL